MRVGLDLDGTCYAFQRTYAYMLRAHHGLDIPPIEEWWTSWDAQKQWGTKDVHSWMWNEGVKKGLFRYGHMIKDTRVALEQLVTNGHKLVVVTTRPENAVQDTLDWVSLFFKDIPLSGLHILSNEAPKTTVEWDVLVDDRIQNYQEAWSAGRLAVLFDQPWNRDAEAFYRARGWKEAVLWIQTLERDEKTIRARGDTI